MRWQKYAAPLVALAAMATVPCPAADDEDRYDKVVDDFIEYDVGRLRGREGQQAWRDFQDLRGEESVPALVRGVNKAAKIQNSCPIIVLSQKLRRELAAARDPRTLRYAIEHLDSSEGQVYGDYVASLRRQAEERLARLNGEGAATSRDIRGGGTAAQLRRSRMAIERWTLEDLRAAVREEEGTELIRALEELQRRRGAEYTQALAEAIAAVDDEMKSAARGLLAQRLTRMTDRTLRAKFEDSDPEVRAAAARAIGYKGSDLYAELAEALRDPDSRVAVQARATLVKLTGEDFGPADDASATERFLASKRWEKWLAEHPPEPGRPREPDSTR